MPNFHDALAQIRSASETSEEALQAAIDAAAAAAISERVSTSDKPLRDTFGSLRKRRHFVAIERLACALERVGFEDAFVLKMHAQSLIERSDYLPAAGLLREARAVAQAQGDAATEADSWGLEGRVFKDLYVLNAGRGARSVRERLLLRAAAAYNWVYARAPNVPSSYYHGVNAMALALRAVRDGLSPPPGVDPMDIADRILRHAKGAIDTAAKTGAEPQLDAWDYANAAEACAAFQDWDQAIVWMNRYLHDALDDAFALKGTLRQFSDVWGVKDADPRSGPLVTALQMALIAAQDGGVDLTREQADNLEEHVRGTTAAFRKATPTHDFALENQRVLGVDGPVSVKRFDDIMKRARAVARVRRLESGLTIGTGFLLAGRIIDPSLAGKSYFITNAHVVSNHPDRDGCHDAPGEVVATFDRANELADIELSNLVWCSGQHHHDMSVFEVYCPHPEIAETIKVARGLPALKRSVPVPGQPGEAIAVPGKVYVIGHPLGQDLSISLYDNDLIDHENVYGQPPGPEPRRIQYRAPTERGNSGSPVFNSITLELIAVHHRGGLMPKLRGETGRHKANQGMWIRPALNEMRASFGLMGDMFADRSDI